MFARPRCASLHRHRLPSGRPRRPSRRRPGPGSRGRHSPREATVTAVERPDRAGGGSNRLVVAPRRRRPRFCYRSSAARPSLWRISEHLSHPHGSIFVGTRHPVIAARPQLSVDDQVRAIVGGQTATRGELLLHGDAFSGLSQSATALGAARMVRPISEQPRQEDSQRVWWGRPWPLPGDITHTRARRFGRGRRNQRRACPLPQHLSHCGNEAANTTWDWRRTPPASGVMPGTRHRRPTTTTRRVSASITT